MERSSGILMPVFSLPSPGGIGTLGGAARRFADFLASAGQRWWQMLPLGPTGYGDSPYQSFSSFAGNPYLIDPEDLITQGLLKPEEFHSAGCGGDAGYVDYARLYQNRGAILRPAAARVQEWFGRELEQFCSEQAFWLDDYALFMALKDRFGGAAWQEWPEPLRNRRPEALHRARRELSGEIGCCSAVQFLFFRQFAALRAYARSRGIGLIGDMPIYASADSADVWSAQELFCLDTDGRPSLCAGVPPDYFSADGQLWGNPIYRWDRMAREKDAWWQQRVQAAAKLYDVLRLDHFRGFSQYWAVPGGAETARDGAWCKGPGMHLLRKLRKAGGGMAFLAEDLGILTPAVERLRRRAGWPGMKVLEFAFDPSGDSKYLPHRLTDEDVCYTGTHDNPPLPLWCGTISGAEDAFARKYLRLGPEESLPEAILRAGMESRARVFLSQLPDWLDPEEAGRINTPGTCGGNWCWRVKQSALNDALCQKILALTCASDRRNTTKYG